MSDNIELTDFIVDFVKSIITKILNDENAKLEVEAIKSTKKYNCSYQCSKTR